MSHLIESFTYKLLILILLIFSCRQEYPEILRYCILKVEHIGHDLPRKNPSFTHSWIHILRDILEIDKVVECRVCGFLAFPFRISPLSIHLLSLTLCLLLYFL